MKAIPTILAAVALTMLSSSAFADWEVKPIEHEPGPSDSKAEAVDDRGWEAESVEDLAVANDRQRDRSHTRRWLGLGVGFAGSAFVGLPVAVMVGGAASAANEAAAYPAAVVTMGVVTAGGTALGGMADGGRAPILGATLGAATGWTIFGVATPAFFDHRATGTEISFAALSLLAPPILTFVGAEIDAAKGGRGERYERRLRVGLAPSSHGQGVQLVGAW